MSTGERRPLLPAVVGPRASAVILRHLEGAMLRYAETHDLAGDVETARELRLAVAQMRESARLRNLSQAGPGSVVVSVEVPETRVGAASECPPRPGSRWLSVDEVVERFGVSGEWVRRLCRDEVLSATRLESRGRPWSIDPASVEDYLEHRRSA